VDSEEGRWGGQELRGGELEKDIGTRSWSNFPPLLITQILLEL